MRFRRGRTRKPRGRELRVERLEQRDLFAGLPYGAMPQDTMELMLGDVAVSVVLFDSDGTNDTSVEDWTQALIDETKVKIQEGLDWWVDTLATQTDVHSLNFIVDWTYADNPIDTQYEPINRRSQDYYMWGNEFLEEVGFLTPSPNPSSQIHEDIRAFNHSQRMQYNADWAFTIFVANSDQDPDDSWNGAGSVFSRAFAHSGGRVIVVPSGRPNSTYAHEIGHQAWGLDEYLFGGDYRDRRGYLDVQNVNAQNNPGHVHEDSIMSNDDWLADAYANNVSSVSSLAMVGWQDSDGDGVFDPLDVPLTLTGTGRANGQTYEFKGSSKVQTLFNQNSKLFADNRWVSDITLNEINRVEYRIDGGDWMSGGTFDSPMVDIDLGIPLPDTAQHTVEIRTLSIDQGTGKTVTTSPIFVGSTDTHEGVASPGLSGFIYQDFAENANLDAEDRGLADWAVELRDDSGDLLVLETIAEPDGFNDNTNITTAFPGVTLTATGSGVSSPNVKALRPGGSTSTGSGVFGSDFSSFTTSIWGDNSFEMRMDFDQPVTRVTLDAVAELDDGYGRLEAYDANDNLIARYTTDLLSPGTVETMMVARSEGDISYALAFGHADTFVRLDNLQFGAEAVTTTDDQGYFEFDYLPSGQYFVTPVSPSSVFENISPGVLEVNYVTNQVSSHNDFAIRNTAKWHNAAKPTDVDDSGSVNFVDAFTVIDGIRNRGIGLLPDPGPEGPPPFYDVNANDRLDLVDAFAVIEAVRLGQSGDEGEGGGNDDSGDNRGGGGVAGGGGAGEGEAPVLAPIAFVEQPTFAERGREGWALLNTSIVDVDAGAEIVVGAQPQSAPRAQSTSSAQIFVAQPQPSHARSPQAYTTGEARSAPSQSLWEARDLGQVDQEWRQEELDSTLADIAEDVDEAWHLADEENPEESSESELSLK